MERKTEYDDTECSKQLKGEAARAMTVLLLFYFGSLAVGKAIILFLDLGKEQQDIQTTPRSVPARVRGMDEVPRHLFNVPHKAAS
jgi:hypothetical protein